MRTIVNKAKLQNYIKEHKALKAKHFIAKLFLFILVAVVTVQQVQLNNYKVVENLVDNGAATYTNGEIILPADEPSDIAFEEITLPPMPAIAK